MQHDYDLIIVGAGLAGNCLALALKNSGLRIAVVEASSRRQLHDSPAGDRALALAAATVELLRGMGVWREVADKATAIRHIHVSDKGHFGKTRLTAHDYAVEALGYVISARDIEHEVAKQAGSCGIDCLYETRVVGLMSGVDGIHVSLRRGNESINLTAKVLVGADGGQSSVRRLLDIPQQITEYGQTALVTTVQASLPHQNTAYERFTAQGPLAFLPVAGKQLAVVWTRCHEQADALMASDEAAFLAELQDCFGYRLGQLRLTAPRRAFPLRLIRAERMVSARAVIIGNAVHQLHPVAGQGFNLGIRDVVHLAELLRRQHLQGGDLGDAKLLARYASQRQLDHNRTIGFTDRLVRIFSNEWFPVTVLRNTGLTMLDHLPFAKRLLARHAMGFVDALPSFSNHLQK